MGYRDDDTALRARLDAVLEENATLKDRLAQASKPAAPAALPGTAAPGTAAPDRKRPEVAAPLVSGRQDRVRYAVGIGLLLFISVPAVVFTIGAVRSDTPWPVAAMMDVIALGAIAAALRARYGPPDLE